MANSIANYSGLDTGGSGVCNTPPTALTAASQASQTVFVNKVPVMVNGDALTDVPGTTPKGDPCISVRTVVASNTTVFVGKKAVAQKGDVLNVENNIKIAGGSQNVFV